MEMSNQLDDKLLSIMEFVHYYDSQVSLSTLLNGFSYTVLLNHVSQVQVNEDEVNKQTVKWSERIQNLQNILYHIEQFFQKNHEKCIDTSHIDLLSLAKDQDLIQVVKYFQVVMAVLMESDKKEQFVQTIMMLQQSSQQVFVNIIKNSLDGNRFTKSKYQNNIFKRIMSEFDQQKLKMEQQIDRLCKANTELLSKIRQYQDTINEYQLDLSTKRSSIQYSVDEGKNTRYLEQYIDKLQLRIVQQTKIFEEQKINNVQKIRDMQQKIVKLQQSEELCKIYKQKYDQIMDQMQKMNIWKKEKGKLEKAIEEKDFIVQKLHERIEQITQKNLILEETQLQIKLELQKKQIKIQKMSNQLKKAMQNIGNSSVNYGPKSGDNYLIDQSLRENLSFKTGQQSIVFSPDEQINQVKKQNEKILKKNKQLQKQICKLTKKVEKVRVLEEDKAKLQQLVFQMRAFQSEELNVIFSVFYDGLEQNIETSKKLRHEMLSFDKEDAARKFRYSKRSESNLSKSSKQNKRISKC